MPFLHLPGPNPIISRGPKRRWDEYYTEAGDVIKDSETYYSYYRDVGGLGAALFTWLVI